MMERFEPEEALRAIERYRVTHSQWVPTMFIRMLRLPEKTRTAYDLSSHRVAVHAAARELKAILERAGGGLLDAKPFRYVDKGTMATIGRRAAVADVRGLKLKGTLGWVAWLVVHIYYLIGFRNRVAVLASWAWDYLRRDRPIRVIVRSEEDPVVSSLEADDPGATG